MIRFQTSPTSEQSLNQFLFFGKTTQDMSRATFYSLYCLKRSDNKESLQNKKPQNMHAQKKPTVKFLL